MTKTPKYANQIEQNRKTITQLLSGTNTVKRLNNLNWLRHEISYTEPRTLFYLSSKDQQPYLDYNSMKNLGYAYDYIVDNPMKHIDATEICKIHSILCTDTHIQGGIFRTSDKILKINVHGRRMHAPDAREIPFQINEILFKMNKDNISPITKAFTIHYDLIALQPFDDFNKRTSRLIMNWVLIQNGYRPVVFNQRTDKQKYIDAFTSYANGDCKAYMSYMAGCLARTQREIIRVLHNSRMQ